MTIKEAKQNLPDVRINVQGRTHKGRTIGRLNPFAIVLVDFDGIDIPLQFSWEAIARSVTYGTILAG